jgi:transcriptional antiterminator NusG
MTSYYCLYCESGQERKVNASLEKLAFRIIPALAEQIVVRGGVSKKVTRHLLPGYVFFESEEPVRTAQWKELCESAHVYRPLGYSNGSKELMGSDIFFIQLLLRRQGKLEVSKAVEEGSRVKIIEGPLKELEGNIIKLNKNRRCAEVEIESFGIVHKVWLSYEVVEETE